MLTLVVEVGSKELLELELGLGEVPEPEAKVLLIGPNLMLE